MTNESVEVNKDDLIKATVALMDFCQAEGMPELLAYMAMITITHTMEEQLGFGNKRKSDS